MKTIQAHADGSRRRGFLLVEVLCAMAIFAVVVLSLYASFSFGFATVQRAREELRATQVLLQKTESIRLYTWDQLSSDGFLPATFTVPYPAGEQQHPIFVFRGTVQVTDPGIKAAYSNDLKRVTVSLAWTSAGAERRREMTTLIARNGLQGYIP